MTILAFPGGNWTRNSIASSQQYTAIAVHRNVLLFYGNGNYYGEIRTRARVNTLNLCPSPLWYLLAVGCDDGTVRVYDIQTRAIFAELSFDASIIYVCFLPSCLNVLATVTARKICVSQFHPNVSSLANFSPLPLAIRCAQVFSKLEACIALGGACENGKGKVCIVNLQTCEVSAELEHDRGPVSGLSLFEADDESIMLAAVSINDSYPACFDFNISTSSWTKTASACATPEDERGKDPSTMSGESSRNVQTSELVTCISWISRDIIVSTSPKGSIVFWQLANSESVIQRIFSLPDAHSRQVFALAWMKPGSLLWSLSMDRSVVLWRVGSKRSDVECVWRGVGTTGPAMALCTQVKPQIREDEALCGSTAFELSSEVMILVGFSDGLVSWWQREGAKTWNVGQTSIISKMGPRREKIEGISVILPFLTSGESDARDIVGESLAWIATTKGRVGVLITNSEASSSVVRFGKSVSARRNHKIGEHITQLVQIDKTTVCSLSVSGNMWRWSVILSPSRGDVSEITGREVQNFAKLLPGKISSLCCPCPRLNGNNTEPVIVYGGDRAGRICALNFDSHEVLSSLKVSSQRITAIAAEPAANVIAAGDSAGNIYLLEDEPKKGRILSTSMRRGSTAPLRHRIESAHPDSISDLQWNSNASVKYSEDSSNDILLLLSSSQGLPEARIWGFATKEGLKLTAQLNARSGKSLRAAWMQKGQVVSGGDDGLIRAWDLQRMPKPTDVLFSKRVSSQ